MSFRSYPNGRSKSRRANRTDVSAQAEPCELRALLSASAITVSLADAAPCDASDAEPDPSVDASAPEKSVDGKAGDMDIDPNVLCVFPCAPQSEDDFDAIEGDAPPMTFITLQPGIVDDAGIIDDSFPFEQPGFDEPFLNGEPAFNDEEVFPQDVIVDAPPVDGWDPSWLYRTSVTPGDDITGLETAPEEFPMSPEDAIGIETWVDDGPGSVWPDGDGSPELFVPVDEPFNDFDGDGLPDEFVIDPVEFDNNIDPLLYMTPDNEGEGAEVPGLDGTETEIYKLPDSDDSWIEEGSYFYPVIDTIQSDGTEFVESFGDDSFVPQIRFLSASGGSDVQRSLTISSPTTLESPDVVESFSVESVAVAGTSATAIDQTSAPAAPIAISLMPIRQEVANSLFDSTREKSSIGAALTTQSRDETPGRSLKTKTSTLPKRLKSQLQSASQQNEESTELDSLSPLVGDGTTSPEVDSASSRQDIQSNDQVTPESNDVTSKERVDSGTPVIAQSTRPSHVKRTRMIDEVMSQYAEDSFNA